MKRNFNAIITNLDGEPLKDSNDADLTLKRVCMDAIGAHMDGDAQMSGDDKFKLYELASRIAKGFKAGEPVEISDTEMTTIKNRVAKVWGVFVVGPVFSLLAADYVAPAQVY